jgi:transcriptional regulator with XRE-family HTH domain
MISLLAQLKKRRIELGIKQHDMMLRVGMSRQQYQRLEAKGNPRLDTLELVAKGLNSELVLIPHEKLKSVKALLTGDNTLPENLNHNEVVENTLANDPWKDLLKDDE